MHDVSRRATDPAVSAMQRRVAPLMLVAIAALVVGMWAGLARIGWRLPAADGDLMLRHGGLMVVGFVATVIGVERAVAVRTLLSLLAPAFSAAAGLALIAGAQAPVAPLFALVAGAAYCANIATLARQHRTLPLHLMLVGAVCLTAAAVEWTAGRGLFRVVPWWMAFLALTIGAERLDLLRFQHATRLATVVGGTAVVFIVVGPLISLGAIDIGARLLGTGLILGSGWLTVRDHPRRGVFAGGLSRYIAVGLLCAYGWLAFAGVALIAEGLTTGGWHYDAVVHAFFIGVVMSSILAHEPIIAPSVLGLEIPFTRLLYGPLVLLEGSLVVRIVSDAAQIAPLRPWAGLVQVLAIVLFLAIVVSTIVRSRLPRREGTATDA